MSEPFIGEIRMFAGNFAPSGWALCDGQLLAISQNQALFSLLGTIYGGDGRTTFGLPELRGRAPMHEGTGPGLSPRVIGQKLGAETETLTVNQLPTHSHAIAVGQATGNAADTSDPTGNSLALADVYHSGVPASVVDMHADSLSVTGTTSGTGSSQPHENMAPFLVVNFIIALTGIYPSRS
jgi:microcystin-dependent protein